MFITFFLKQEISNLIRAGTETYKEEREGEERKVRR